MQFQTRTGTRRKVGTSLLAQRIATIRNASRRASEAFRLASASPPLLKCTLSPVQSSLTSSGLGFAVAPLNGERARRDDGPCNASDRASPDKVGSPPYL